MERSYSIEGSDYDLGARIQVEEGRMPQVLSSARHFVHDSTGVAHLLSATSSKNIAMDSNLCINKLLWIGALRYAELTIVV